jgi:multidrug efflux pump subunit AcrA (membrane-fusion protein)
MFLKMLRFVILPILIVAAGGVAMWALGTRQQGTRDDAAQRIRPRVETVKVLPHSGGLDIQVDGVVAPFREIEVAAEVSGRVIWKAPECRAGAYVRKDTELIKIDPTDYQLEVARLENQIEQAMHEKQENRTEAENLQHLIDLAIEDVQVRKGDWLRKSNAPPNTVSSTEIDAAKQSLLQAQNALQTLENQQQVNQDRSTRILLSIRQAELQRDRAKRDLARTTLCAPVDGVIIRDDVEQDAYVQQGRAVFTIEDTSAVEVLTSLKMEELYWLWQQQASTADATAKSPAEQAYGFPATRTTVFYQFAGRSGPKYAWQGELQSYDGLGLDERTRTVPCRILVSDPRAVSQAGGLESDSMRATGPPALMRGMYVTATVHATPVATFVKVPELAVQPGKQVWRVREGRLERVGPLELVQFQTDTDPDGRERGYWMVPSASSGLEAGDSLSVTPLSGMRDGMEVEL